MPDALGVIKQAAVEAVDAEKPVLLCYGKVISADPLKIQVEQKMILTEKMLVLTRNVTDFYVDVEVSHKTVETLCHVLHLHYYKGRKKVKIYNALVEGDHVLLGREKGGKKYVVMDRIKPIPILTGEWL